MVIRRLRRLLRSAGRLYSEFFWSPYREQIYREYLQQRDALYLMTCSEMVGLPNPAMFYTLELLPEVIDQFHHWHLRMGMEHPPEGGFRCC